MISCGDSYQIGIYYQAEPVPVVRKLLLGAQLRPTDSFGDLTSKNVI
jgi:hypothetical protein